MSEFKEVSVPLEDLHCASCKGYLSCAPIQVLRNGNSICGNCSPLYGDEPTQRELTLESILRKISFPCQFKEYGCKEELLFGHTGEHEAECKFRSFDCPFLPYDKCVWKGSVLQMQHHFVNAHPDAVIQNMKFKLEVNEDKEEILAVIVDDVNFIMKYVYCTETSNLQYDIRYLAFNVQEVCCKVVLANDVDEDYSVTVKGSCCLPYDANFFNTQNEGCLFLNNLLPILNKPDRILITMNLMVKLECAEEKDETEKSEEVKEKLVADYDLLETLRCKQCKKYVIPRVYYSESNEHVFCNNCKENSDDYKLLELLKLIGQANYPCRWRGCEVVERVNNISEHERLCQFRMYGCLNGTCRATFRKKEIVTHLKEHGLVGNSDKITFKMVVLSLMDSFATVYSCICSEIVAVTSTIQNLWLLNQIECEFKVTASCGSLNNIKAEIHFEHDHCKLKSQKFYITSSRNFNFNDLPHCFRGGNFRAILKLICDCSSCQILKWFDF